MFILISLSISCTEDIRVWDTNSKDVLYFNYLKTVGNDPFIPVDSINFPLPISKDSIIEYPLSIGIMGMLGDKDRAVHFEVLNDSLTTAVEDIHYSAKTNGSIKAGEVVGSIPITFYRERDPLLADSVFSLHIRLLESDDFRLEGENDSIVIYFTDGLGFEPTWWSEELFGSTYHEEVAIMILEKFHSIKDTYPTIYEEMITEFGENLEIPPKGYGNEVFKRDYYSLWVSVICTPVYEWVQANPDLGLTFKDPRTIDY